MFGHERFHEPVLLVIKLSLDWHQALLDNPAHTFAIFGVALGFGDALQHPTLILLISFTAEHAMVIFVDFPLFQIFIGEITIDETPILLSRDDTAHASELG